MSKKPIKRKPRPKEGMARRAKDYSVQRLKTIVSLSNELLACRTVDEACRKAVELARDRLGVERCSIFMRSGDEMHGTYGTNRHGLTTDEHACILPLDEKWRHLLAPRTQQDSHWVLLHEPRTEWDGLQPVLLDNGGWIAATPMLDSSLQPVAVFINDAAISGAAFNEDDQELICAYCTLLAGILRRKQDEESLARAHREWEKTFDAVPDLMAILDLDHHIVRANKAMADRLGTIPAELAGKACHECVHGTLHPPLFCPHSLLLKDGQPHTAEVYEEKLKGHFLVTVSPLRFDDGTLVGSVHVARDISDRVQAEKMIRVQHNVALALSHAKDVTQAMNLIVRAAANLEGVDYAGLYWVDEETGALELKAHHNLPASVLPAISSYPKESIQAQMIQEGRPIHGRYSTLMGSGPADPPGTDFFSRQKALSVVPILNAGQVMAALVASSSSLDLLAPVCREALETLGAYMGGVYNRFVIQFKLREQEERYRLIAEGASDMISLHRVEDLSYLYMNDAVKKTLGFSEKDLMGTSAWALVHPDEMEWIKNAFAKALVESKGIVEFRCRRKDGAYLWVEVHGQVLREFSGSPLILLIARDITGRKNRQVLEIQEREQRRIGQDLHDGICQQLSGVQMLAALLSRSLDKRKMGEESRQAGAIQRELEVLIQQAHGLARGLLPVPRESFGLQAALEDLAADVSCLFKVKCRFHCPVFVGISNHQAATHLYRIAQEAASNAIQHGKATCIDIRLRERDGSLILSIQNNGVPIPNSHLNQSGMGLHIMQYRAQEMGGSVDVHNQKDGGVEVECRMPLNHKEPES